MEDSQSRNLEHVNEMIQLAKLTDADLVPTTQMVYFSSEGLNNNLKLLELDNNLLKAIKEGETLYIKGQDEDNAVLCTGKDTYDLTLGETSDSLLLVQNMEFFDNINKSDMERAIKTINVSATLNEYMLVTPSKSHLRKLRELLNKSLYNGPENEHNIQESETYTYEELNNIVQMCEAELKKNLASMATITLNNRVRLLDFEYHFRVLSFMLKLIDENSWALDEIEFEETINALKDIFPEAVLMSLFDKYVIESKIIDGLQLYSYKEDEVCKFFAQVLLHGAGKLTVDEFLQIWRDSVPEGMVPKEELLYGIAVVDTSSKPHFLCHFPEEKLPEDIHERFNELFRVKSKWTVAEITPYIKRVANSITDENSILAKFARASTIKGVKYYSAKHSK